MRIEKAVKELTTLLKNENNPKSKNQSYWNLLKTNLAEEGTWEDDFLDSIKDKIYSWLNNLKVQDLQALWGNSESAAGYPEDETIKQDFMLGELADELLDMILEQIEEVTPREEFFISETKTNENFYEDDDADELNLNQDMFDNDELDEFDDDYYGDDDRY